jgi:hypothetical protein
MRNFVTLLNSFFILTIFIGCAKDEPKGLSDAELIQSIIDAESKLEIGMESLPSSAKESMEDNYLKDYYHLQSLKASMLGYEVSIAGKPGRLGKRTEVYFNIEGKKLDYSENEKNFWNYGNKEYSRNEFGDKRDWVCFSIEYPITVTTPRGNTYTFENEESVKEYYEAYEIDEDIAIVYPINITDSEGELSTIDSDGRLKEIYKECYGRDRNWIEKKKCFSLIYPVNYQMPDGILIEVYSDTDESGWAEIKAWYDENINSDERHTLQYPVDIIYEIDEADLEEGTQDQRIVTINSEDEMMIAKRDCRDIWGEVYEHWKKDSKCFELVYPALYLMPDGIIIEVAADDEESWTELKSWYDENESEQEPELQYPVEIVYRTEQGSDAVTINSEDEMIRAKEECRELEYEEDEEGEDCYEYIYPITFILPDESAIVVLSEEDESAWGLIRRFYEENTNYEEEPLLQFPVQIVHQIDMAFVLETREALAAFIEENCNIRE